MALSATTPNQHPIPDVPQKPTPFTNKMDQTAIEMVEVERNASQLLATRERQLRIDTEKALAAEVNRNNDAASSQFPSRESVSEKIRAFHEKHDDMNDNACDQMFACVVAGQKAGRNLASRGKQEMSEVQASVLGICWPRGLNLHERRAKVAKFTDTAMEKLDIVVWNMMVLRT